MLVQVPALGVTCTSTYSRDAWELPEKLLPAMLVVVFSTGGSKMERERAAERRGASGAAVYKYNLSTLPNSSVPAASVSMSSSALSGGRSQTGGGGSMLVGARGGSDDQGRCFSGGEKPPVVRDLTPAASFVVSLLATSTQ